jgi:uncharacterized protein YjbJ (UPF0337 family)
MNRDILKGQWNQLLGEMKTKWGKLTDDDWAQAKGSYDKLLGRVQERYGYQREQAQHEIDSWLAHHLDTVAAKLP